MFGCFHLSHHPCKPSNPPLIYDASELNLISPVVVAIPFNFTLILTQDLQSTIDCNLRIHRTWKWVVIQRLETLGFL